MDSRDGWPAAVAGLIRSVYGEPAAIERLPGMSLSAVYRLRCSSGSIVAKTSPTDAEARFYEHVAEPLREAGIPTPRLARSLHLPDSHWLILEDLPQFLPVPHQDRWQPDPRIVGVLARLHATTRRWSPDLPAAPARSWTDAVTDGALACFPAATGGSLTPLLRALQRESERLSEPWCWISGDPNPSNWGVRVDGSLALFDWAEFRPGVPAIDLAITVAGLGHSAKFAALAACYADVWDEHDGSLPWSCPQLGRDIALAKVWTVASVLNNHSRSAVRPSAGLIERLVAGVPAWVRSLV